MKQRDSTHSALKAFSPAKVNTVLRSALINESNYRHRGAPLVNTRKLDTWIFDLTAFLFFSFFYDLQLEVQSAENCTPVGAHNDVPMRVLSPHKLRHKIDG